LAIKAKQEAEQAKNVALTDLDVMQKKTQFELINTIVKVALYVIIGVGLTTTALYTVALFTDQDTQIIGSTWSNMFGILLTNAFSIVGTIMGVKYASEKPKKN
jgi:hydrogenase maturation factor